MPWTNGWDKRRALVEAMRRRWEPVSTICQQFGASRAFAYRLWRRCDQEGWPGLRPKRRGPKGWRHPLADQYRCWIRRFRRRQPGWGARKLWRQLRERFPRRHLPGLRTVERWLREWGLVRPQRKRQHIMAPPLGRVRQARRSNDRWSFDWKGWKLGRDGRRFEPLTVRDEATSLILFARPLRDRSERTVQAVCRKLFRRHGRPRAIRVDHGGPFCGHGPYGFTTLSLWWHRLGIRVEFVNRKAGLHNNAHEQMHRVLEEEVMQPKNQTYQTMLRRLQRWQQTYNHDRPHDGLRGRTPAQCYRSAPASLPQPKTPSYPSHWLVRRVGRSGSIGLRSDTCYVGRAFAGQLVGCQWRGDHFRIYYARLLLRRFLPPVLQEQGRG